MDFCNGKWIWAEENTRSCDRVIFRRAFSLDKPPKTATVTFCARDTASFYVNGKPVALGVTGCVSYDVAKYLNKGENVLGFDCLYYGAAANGYEPPEWSGLIVASDALGIYSDEQFSVYRPYWQDDGDPHPSGRYYGFNSYVDGNRGELGGVFDVSYGSTLFAPATEYGAGGETEESAPVNRVYDGATKVKKMTKTTEGVTVTYVCDLGEEKAFYPVIELVAMGTERVEIRSDRYVAHGGWGSEQTYNGVRGVYICRNGTQEYFSPVPLYGSVLVITAPATVNIRTVDLHVTRYPAKRALWIDGDDRIRVLVDKCDNTMRACMDGGIIDNTDRDRGCDLFALSTFARSAVYTYDDSVMPLLRDALLKVAAGELKNYAGGPFGAEHPVSTLLFCSQLGAVASYWYRTGDSAPVKELYPAMSDYLLGWTVEDGRVLPRRGDAKRADAGYNVDEELITACLYYSAAKFLLETVEAAEVFEFPDEISRRANAIENGFARNYWHESYFSSGEVCDERANASVVLAGLSEAEDAAPVKKALCSCYNASPAFEGFVAEALGRAGFAKEAKERIVRRYLGWIENENTVLPEYFYHEGSKCSSLSVSPAAAYLSGVLGIRYTGPRRLTVTLTQTPDDVRVELPAGNGGVKVQYKGDTVLIENNSGREIEVLQNGTSTVLPKGKCKLPRYSAETNTETK